MANISCPICKLAHSVSEKQAHANSAYHNEFVYACKRCGDFVIIDDLKKELNSHDKSDFMLSAWIREHKILGNKPPNLNTINIIDIRKNFKNYTPSDRQNILLKNIERLTRPGRGAIFNAEFDLVLAWADNYDEYMYYLNALSERELISIARTHEPDKIVQLTYKGWDYLENYSRDIGDKTQAFVAMSFSPELDSIWEDFIKNAIIHTGYTPYRVDKEPHNQLIDVKIMAEIKNSRFLVADFTGNKHGVYFEAGYALGLGIPVIWCARKDCEKDLHFDTEHYGHILWTTGEELQDKLTSYIRAIIGEPSKKVK